MKEWEQVEARLGLLVRTTRRCHGAQRCLAHAKAVTRCHAARQAHRKGRVLP
jgi:hypothetical protein